MTNRICNRIMGYGLGLQPREGFRFIKVQLTVQAINADKKPLKQLANIETMTKLIYRLDKTHLSAGGVVIYAKDNISYVVRHDLSEILTEAESLWLEVILNGKKTVISFIYRHPAHQYDSFTKELEKHSAQS